jgi:hypothetical protein
MPPARGRRPLVPLETCLGARVVSARAYRETVEAAWQGCVSCGEKPLIG